ncbi:MAG: outer membrane protein OmpK, partial [Amphritea sp.]
RFSESMGYMTATTNSDIAYLNGSDYEVGDPDRQVLTVEHASGHSWGDNFFFMDRLKSDNDSNETYFELSPRLSLSYLTGADLSFGPVTDVFLAGTLEGGQNPFNNFDNYLVGVGVSLDVPGFWYFKANVYHASNDITDNNEQLTLVWGLPFDISNAEFLYDGFLDWSSSTANLASEMNFTSQLKWNAGQLIGTKAPVYVGVEYAYWNNKFGIRDADERNPALLLKWHF